ncbi:hypothetical protein BDV36DRAFT_281804 [Aspergillus pseudocaelatus]|uniref:Uncharacterized protein n=1 Tax=Aspergillus pseudocaelatus TaxID=1825620 RepID=A0ABQ6WSK7_9EURO|nr:hypothetical protein BDV36DRAFT_281804 [Aspergillus pseudocaelatus]
MSPDRITALSPQYKSEEDGVIVYGCCRWEFVLVQSCFVTSKLGQILHPSPNFQITTGILSKLIDSSDIGKSLWTNCLELDLVTGKIHYLVHYLLRRAVPEYKECSDTVYIKSGLKFIYIDQLLLGSIIEIRPSRRKDLVQHNWPYLKIVECIDNIEIPTFFNTCVDKLDISFFPFSCILLATARLLGLSLGHRITHHLEFNIFLMQWREIAERAMLRCLWGGYLFTSGCDSSRGNLSWRAMVLYIEVMSGTVAEDVSNIRCDEIAKQPGITVASIFLRKGARSLIPEQF